jgi:hypothetical protein
MVRFADCLRSHGVATVPDPTAPHPFKEFFASNAARGPAFQSAMATCHQLQPGGGPQGNSEQRTPAQIAALLALARCMRGHGFPRFPDPTSGGQITHEMLAANGIDLHQPAFVQAADACVGVTHGLLTKVDVANFIAGH